ncbi:MAG: 30S ribosomal protein S12 methylthiotransferase RimO, partial [Candidatus Sumerlaeia bacterium]|nr:30S ribosomal protein S12 methylthiotransferase RimO [Candidatus Sumerlaeia bacterium]
IIGFPGETDRQFQRLSKRLKELHLDRVGFFLYSAEKGTKAEQFSGSVPRSVARQRLKQIYSLQGEIAYRQNKRWIGSIREVLVEAKLSSKGHRKNSHFYLCRSQGEAPEVDGYVIVESVNRFLPGDRIKVVIRNATAYDFLANEVF